LSILNVENIYQGDEEGCGLACLRMLLSLVSHQKNYRYLTLEGHPPYSLEQLKKAAGKEGLTLVFKRVESKDNLYQNSNWPLLLLLGEEADSHCVLARKCRRDKILINDPANGEKWVKKEILYSKWNGIYGEVASYYATKCPFQKKKALFPWSLGVASVCEVLAEAALYFGFYNVQKNANYLYSVLAFAIFGFLDIFKRSFAVQGMKTFDEAYLDKIADSEPHRLRNNYEHYYRYKSLFFGGWIEFVGAFFFSFALLFLVSLNSPFFLASALGFLAFAVFEGLYWQHHLQQEKTQLERDEKAYFISKDAIEEKIEALHRLNDKSYQLGDYVSYSGAIRLVLSLALALIPMLAEQKISLNYFLFHFFALLAVGEGFEKMVAFFLKGPERSQEFDYFLEYFLKEEK
jgi:predicted double-glycine peptidase